MSVPIMMGCGCSGAHPPGGDGLDASPDELHYFASKVWAVGNFFKAGAPDPRTDDSSYWTYFRPTLCVFDTVGNVSKPGFIITGETFGPAALGVYGAAFSGTPNDSGGIFYIGGSFNKVNSRQRATDYVAIAGLKADGSISATFNYAGGSEPDNSIILARYSANDSRLYAQGPFTTIGATARAGLAKFNLDGSLDTSFNPGTGPDGAPVCMLASVGGGIWIGGGFLNYNGSPTAAGFALINASGAIASDVTRVISGGVHVILEDPGASKLFIGGTITNYDGVSGSLFRLLSDQSVDSGFTPPGTISDISALALQDDDKLIVGCSVGGAGSVVRLNTDGTLDSSFNVTLANSVFPFSPSISAVLALPSLGGIVIAGNFTSVNSGARKNIAFLSQTGALLS